MPENNLENVNAFFKELLTIPDLASSYILLFFLSCTNSSRFSEFVRIREGVMVNGRKEYQKTMSLDNLQISETQVRDIAKIGASLGEIQKVQSADLNLLADNVFEFTQAFFNEFHDLKKTLEDIQSLFDTLCQKMNKAAESFGMAALQFKKINYAKTQFPLFNESNINLDQVFTRHKLVFYQMSNVIASQAKAFESFQLNKNEQCFNDVLNTYKVKCKVQRSRALKVKSKGKLGTR